MEKISVIIPCYNEEEVIPIIFNKLYETFGNLKDFAAKEYDVVLDFELLFVDDGSKDKTLACLKEIVKRNSWVRYISFSRNFGKEAAIYAGLENTTGDYVAIMDADMQDPPEMLEKMFRSIKEEDYDIAATRRNTRVGEPKIRSYCAKLFYKLINKLSKTEIVDGARDFRLMTRQVVNAILEVGEYNRFSKGIFGWVGFNTKWFSYENCERVAGTTKWSFWQLLVYSLDGIVAFSTVPLTIAAFMGIIFFIISLILIIFIIIRTLIWKDPTHGWPSLVCIIFFVSGIQLFCMGILGQYLSKTYLETKKRPIYIIKDRD